MSSLERTTSTGGKRHDGRALRRLDKARRAVCARLWDEDGPAHRGAASRIIEVDHRQRQQRFRWTCLRSTAAAGARAAPIAIGTRRQAVCAGRRDPASDDSAYKVLSPVVRRRCATTRWWCAAPSAWNAGARQYASPRLRPSASNSCSQTEMASGGSNGLSTEFQLESGTARLRLLGDDWDTLSRQRDAGVAPRCQTPNFTPQRQRPIAIEWTHREAHRSPRSPWRVIIKTTRA